MESERHPHVRVPRSVHALGAIVIAASALLAARLVWEQTFLTWANGPQMIGFALAHGYWAPLMLAPLVLAAWIAVIGLLVLLALVRRRRVTRATLVSLGVALCVGTLLLTPYGVWQRLYADRLARGPYVGEFMVFAAATGDVRTVAALLRHGANIGSSNRSGASAVHAAAVANQVDVLSLLIDSGANLDAVDRSGDSPLEAAVSAGSRDAARMLEAHGARRIRGTEAQRQRAIEEMVAEDIDTMDR